MKVCRITEIFPPPWSGLAPGIFELSRAQQENGIELEILTRNGGYFEGMKISEIRGFGPLFASNVIKRLKELNKEEKIQAIHNHSRNALLSYLLKYFCKKNKIKLFLAVHSVTKAQYEIFRNNDLCYMIESTIKERMGDYRKMNKKNLRKFFNIVLFKEKICFNNHEDFLAVSNGVKQQLVENYNIPADKINVVYNGVDFETFNKTNKDKVKKIKNKYANKGHLLLYVGRLRGSKGIASIIAALPKIVEKKPNTRLLIIGKKDFMLKYFLKMVEKLKLKNKVFFVDNVPYNEIKDYYHAADIFVFPTFTEGMPKVLLEAMACGLPAITTNVCGCNELIKNNYNGCFIDINRPGQIAEKVIRLIENPKLAGIMGKRSKQIVKKKFTWEKVADRCKKVYSPIS